MDTSHKESTSCINTQHCFAPAERPTDRTDQCSNGIVLRSIHQLLTGRLVWLPTTCRICIQQQISRNYQEHTFVGQLRLHHRIQDDWSSDPSKAGEDRRNDSITLVIKERDSGRAIMTEVYCNLGRKADPNLQSSDIVWLFTRNFKTRGPSSILDYIPSRKLIIFAKIGTSAYKLALAPLMSIDNRFHMSLLESCQENHSPCKIKELPLPFQIERENRQELHEIIDSRLHQK